MLRFFRVEAAGGIVMLAAALVAIVWANSPWEAQYSDLLDTHLSIGVGSVLRLDQPLEAWINDALMVIFFFVVGLEIKRELVVGELREPSAALFPAVAALGGMVVPAAVYAAFNAGGEASAGWGIPMATDIAFAVGVVSLLGSRVSGSMKLFLLTLAIVDDIGAILVIAVFYTDDLSLGWLMAALATIVVLVLMRISRIWYLPTYLIVGTFLWLALFQSGVHATIAGVILGILTPARPLLGQESLDHGLAGAISGGWVSAPEARRASFDVRERVSVADRLSDLLHPWSSFLIVPVFALANAGVKLSGDAFIEGVRSPVTLGIAAGLVLGKLVGVSSFAWLAVRSGLCSLPRGATWAHLVGIGALAGIGFTVSLFITNLAFTDNDIIDQSKLGIIVASLVAAIVGSAILGLSRPGSDVLHPGRITTAD